MNHWAAEDCYLSAEHKAKTGYAVLRKNGRYVGKIVASFSKEIVAALNNYKPQGKRGQGATLIPVLAVLTAFTVAAVIVAQSGLLRYVVARLAAIL